MNYFLPVVFLLLSQFAGAQTIMTYQDGRPAFEKKLTDVEGTELLAEDWLDGSVLTKDGKTYTGLHLKYNLMIDQFFFQDRSGSSMAFVNPLQEVRLGESTTGSQRVFRNGFPPVASHTSASFYEVLADGDQQLLKKVVKVVVESKEYNSPTLKKQIQDIVQYYLHSANGITVIKKDKSALIAAMPGKESAINAYVSSVKPNLKKEEELVKLVRHLNGQ